IVIALANLFPFQQGGYISDGARLSMLLFYPKRRERFFAVLAAEAAQGRQARADLMKPSPIERELSVPDGSPDAFRAGWFSYISARNRKDSETAAKYLEQC